MVLEILELVGVGFSARCLMCKMAMLLSLLGVASRGPVVVQTSQRACARGAVKWYHA